MFKKEAMQSEQRLPTLFRSVQFRHGRETIFRKRAVQTAFFCHSQKASTWTLGQESKNQHVAPSDLVLLFCMGAGLSYQRKHTSELELGWPPLMCSNSAPGQTGRQHLQFVSPHEHATRQMHSPSFLSSSLSLE